MSWLVQFLAPPIGLLALFLVYAHHRLPKIEVRRLAGRNGTNNVWRVIVDPTAPYPVAVLAQEVFESRWKKWPHRLILNRTAKGAREREILGHEVEVQTAHLLGLYRQGDDINAHRYREARAMRAGYDGAFSAWTEDRIIEAMQRRSRECAAWAREWGPKLAREFARRNTQ